ncbi:uracil-DNA glycosylase family protein [Sphingorhabdus sp. Alg239-R122]|uniref:uracil-DNA glycosylase family protein n=1 Tax=Sphingorhabdus sp. Alg239-R122 TaxID=2305989 RepID=UPI0013DCB303|nr:uracil-DNA glycosylase family protein [Sphingorhabdus sp. Alg239-R122]
MTTSSDSDIEQFRAEVRGCNICSDLPLGPRPIFQIDPRARILIAGQAPGRITHHKDQPFDDPSGERLRAWMGIDRSIFYDTSKVAIVPIGLCFPGTGKSGDFAPRAECASAWREKMLARMPDIACTLVIGRYALDWHIGPPKKASLTSIVQDWKTHAPVRWPMPHPSPRNNRWLKTNPWFESDVLPALRARIASLLND